MFFFFCNVLNIFLGCEVKREEKKKMHVLIYFIDLFLFYVFVPYSCNGQCFGNTVQVMPIKLI